MRRRSSSPAVGWQFTQAHRGVGCGGLVTPHPGRDMILKGAAPCCPWGQAWQPQALETCAFPRLTFHHKTSSHWDEGNANPKWGKNQVDSVGSRVLSCNRTTECLGSLWHLPQIVPPERLTAGLMACTTHKDAFSTWSSTFGCIRFRCIFSSVIHYRHIISWEKNQSWSP